MDEKRKKIMILDDEPDVVDVLTHCLSLRGFDVSAEVNPAHALGTLDAQGADLVLLDMKLPGMDGPEVAKMIKLRHPESRIVAVTAYPDMAEMLQKNNLIEKLFVKPVEMHELCASLTTMLASNPTTTASKNVCARQTKVVTAKARVLFVIASPEEARFLSTQIKDGLLRNNNFSFAIASHENEIFNQKAASSPDIIVVDESYSKRIDVTITQKLAARLQSAKDIFIWDLTASVYDYNQQVKLMERLRSICIAHNLFEIKLVGDYSR